MLRSNLKAGNNYTSDPLDSAKFLIHQEETMDRYKREYEDRIFTFDYDAFTRNQKQYSAHSSTGLSSNGPKHICIQRKVIESSIPPASFKLDNPSTANPWEDGRTTENF